MSDLTFPSQFKIAGWSLTSEEIIRILSPFASEERLNKIYDVCEKRHRLIVPVLDEIHDDGNITAVMRTAEAMGLMSIILFNNVKIKPIKPIRKVSKNAHQWLQIKDYHRTKKAEVLTKLKQDGFLIVTTNFGPNSIPPERIPLDKKMLIVLGNEKHGVSDEIEEMSDLQVRIPIQGFSQSFNISVAAGIIFNQILSRTNQNDCKNNQNHLTMAERSYLKASYLLKAIQGSEKLIEHQLQRL